MYNFILNNWNIKNEVHLEYKKSPDRFKILGLKINIVFNLLNKINEPKIQKKEKIF